MVEGGRTRCGRRKPGRAAQPQAPRRTRKRRGACREPLPPVHPPAVATSLLMAGDPARRRASPTGSCPVSALPQVDYPTIQVMTFYPGASPDVMASSVTAPLERQFGQMPGLKQMTSTSSSGSSRHHAAVRPRSRHRRRRAGGAGGDQRGGHVPARATCRIRRSTARSTRPTRRSSRSALTSATLPLSEVEDLADTRLAQKISQLPGVGLVSISGGQKPAVRIQANPHGARRATASRWKTCAPSSRPPT